MVIDERKVNLAEADIEQWLWENPGAVNVRAGLDVVEWTGRQFKVPSGIADLIGLTEDGDIVVVEVKNGPIAPDALTQVTRYAKDIEDICVAAAYKHKLYDQKFQPIISRVVIGKSIDGKTLTEAEAMGIETIAFGLHLHLTLSPLVTSSLELRRHRDRNQEIGEGESGQRLIQRKIFGALHDNGPGNEQDEEADLSGLGL